ncbi:mechanosensitive ion channel family protein [Paracerasibacillus soli]|uniref:Mechanosensitive ion channel family protein n=2 Tax=Paracerasibacillus soli TaxID=480284 RepID=A0ABU5CTC8_9BACI|nr:mechanosensitive ion channel family protein [Virgibacillus soli]MDY0409620.1 mechanosensitive ion channel family protein [Virgibacillus soli]
MAATTSTLFNKINEKTNFKIDEILIPFLSRALQIVIIAIGLTIILKELDYPIDGLIAGLGLGGLAFSLAAKDALANLFGGVIIITERPFTIGDWILTPSVEGTVEDITFRSTKIRTFAQALVTVPNATLANESITNWSKMGKRRITFTITIAYDTPSQKIKKVVNEIDQLLKNHPEVHPETIFVTCDDFSANGLDLYLYFFTNTTDWGAYLKVKEEINLKILDILDAENVVIALPSRKLYVESEQESPSPINETKQRAQDS